MKHDLSTLSCIRTEPFETLGNLSSSGSRPTDCCPSLKKRRSLPTFQRRHALQASYSLPPALCAAFAGASSLSDRILPALSRNPGQIANRWARATQQAKKCGIPTLNKVRQIDVIGLPRCPRLTTLEAQVELVGRSTLQGQVTTI